MSMRKNSLTRLVLLPLACAAVSAFLVWLFSGLSKEFSQMDAQLGRDAGQLVPCERPALLDAGHGRRRRSSLTASPSRVAGAVVALLIVPSDGLRVHVLQRRW